MLALRHGAQADLVTRSSFVTYDQVGRATHQISASAHRIEVTCSASDRRLGAAALFVAANYGLLVLDHLRRSSMDAGTIFMLLMSLLLVPLWWMGAMTFWWRFRIDVERDKITLRARAFDPRERVAVQPLRDFLGVTTFDTRLGPRLFFEFASPPGCLAPVLWMSGGKLAKVQEWISNAVAEMFATGAPAFYPQVDDGQAAASLATTNRGPALAPWPPPPRAVPLWHRVTLVLGVRVALASVALMIFAPAAASALFATDVTSPWLFAVPTVRTTAMIETCERTDFRADDDTPFVRRIRYRFEVDGATWRSISYNVRRCPQPGTSAPVEYPFGLPSRSRLHGMYRHPLPATIAPLLVAIVLYALGELVAAFVAAAGKIRFLREGRISLAVFETKTPVRVWYGNSFFLLFRVLAGGRQVQSAYTYGRPDGFEHQQLILYDPRRPANRHFAGLMGPESLSAFGGIATRSVGATLLIGVMLAIALLLVFRAVHWTVLHHV